MALFGPPNIEKLKANRDINGLIKALSYKKESIEYKHTQVREAAAQALGEIGDPRAINALIAALPDKSIRPAVVEALGKFKDASILEPLVNALKDTNQAVTGAAASALGRLSTRPQNDALRTRAVQLLIVALKDSSSAVRSQAAELLGTLHSPHSVEPLVATLKDSIGSVRISAARALGLIGDSRGILPLINAFRVNKIGSEHEAVKDALITIGSPAVDPLITALSDVDVDVRQPVVHVLAQLGDPRSIQPLIESLHDSNIYVRKDAAEALDRLGWRPAADRNGAWYWIARQEWDQCIQVGTPALGPLIAVLGDVDHRVRDRAVEALIQLGDARAVEPLIDLMGDSNGLVRISAAEVLGKLGDNRAVDPLIVALKDSDRDIRQAAAQALADLYQANKLDAPSRQSIVAVRKLIERRHSDFEDDWDSQCQMYRSHEDKTEGVEINFGEISTPSITDASQHLILSPSPEKGSFMSRLVDVDKDVCMGAVEELLGMRNTFAAQTIIQALPYTPHQGLMGTALGMLGTDLVVEPLVAALKDKQYPLRRVTALLLGIFPDARAIEPLIAALHDENEEVRFNARKSLNSLASDEKIPWDRRQTALEALQ
jgi:HEAT repeat protein